MREDFEQVLEEVRTALRDERGAEILTALVEDVHSADLADLYPLLDDEEQSQLIFMLPARTSAEIIAELDDVDRDDAVEDLDEAALTEIVSEMPPDDAADLLGDLSDDQREEVLEHIPDEQSEQLEGLLEHDEESAGGIMTPELVSLPETATVAEAIEQVRRFAEDEEIHYVYTVDDAGRLKGLVPLRRLVTSGRQTSLSAIAEDDPVTVRVGDDQELVANKIRKYDVAAVPVVDGKGKLVGRVTHDDILDVAQEEAAEDLYYMAGTDAAELDEPSPFRAASIRLRWLAICLVGTTCSGTAVAIFKGHLDPNIFIAMVFFMPMMGAMSGNSGIQISTIIVRSLATGDMESKRIGRDFSREMPITLIMAPVCAVTAGAIALIGLPILQHQGQVSPSVNVFHIALAVSCGMGSAIAIASVLGMTLPHVFRKIGVDPAMASGPLVTSANDFLSVTIYYSVGLLIVR